MGHNPDQKNSIEKKADSYYSLMILVFVTIFMNADRSLMTMLLDDIKLDLGITDAQMGFIFGTAISIFYAIFCIPLGRLADLWIRKDLIAIGIAASSLMVAFAGLSKNFLSLALFRVGVGVGESSAAPAAYSMIADYFPIRRRALAMSIYSGGISVGVGIGILMGGYLLSYWDNVFPEGSVAPFGIKRWQFPVFILALAGLILSVFISRLKEPVRGAHDGIKVEHSKYPFRETLSVFKSIFPGVSAMELYRLAGMGAVKNNIILLFVLVLVASILVRFTGSFAQWASVFTGLYCLGSWMQVSKHSDYQAFSAIFKSRAIVYLILGLSLFLFVTSSLLIWAPTFFQRLYGVDIATLGLWLGVSSVVGGIGGSISGGLLADRLRVLTLSAGCYVILTAIIITGPTMYCILRSETLLVAILFYGLFTFCSNLWMGVAPAVLCELVPVQMRGTVSAVFIICITLLGVAIGPFAVGFLSDYYSMKGFDNGPSLRKALLIPLYVLPVAMLLIIVAGRYMRLQLQIEELPTT